LALEQTDIAWEVADSLAIAIQHTQLLESVKQQGEHLRALTARLAETEENERRQMARELHDQVGQNLTALGINLNLVRTHMPEETPVLARSRLDDSLALVEETVDRTRDVMANLRPPMLDDYGLVATLHWYSERFASWTGVSVIVHGKEPVPRLDTLAENALFRIAQEALTNVCKHAQATQVTVTVTADDEAVSLVVADDGVGFDPAQLTTLDGRRGWGLVIMTERAEAVGGSCRIESRPQHGTRVIVEVAR
jgi:signal transduction histidine kinase